MSHAASDPLPRRSRFCSALGLALTACTLAVARPMTNLPADVAVEFNQTRNTVARIEGGDLLRALPEQARHPADDPARTSVAFVSAFRDVFRLAHAADELKTISVQRDDLGFQHVRLQQMFRGLEVVNCGLLFHFNRAGALYLVTGDYIPTPAVRDIQPKLGREAAIRAAAAALKTEGADWPATLKIWPAHDGTGILAYEIAASVAPDRAWRVFVDAQTGKILNRVSTVYTGSAAPSRNSESKSAKP